MCEKTPKFPYVSRFLPAAVGYVLRTLADAGFEAWLVGGCVRDLLLGIAPHDWDVCTNALPEQTRALFPQTADYGIRHGTVAVITERSVIEVTTYRAEGAYSDHRRPDGVTFVRDLAQDLARRDFTVNAMAMDAAGTIHDPFHGMDDLRARTLRCVGDPDTRFREDALRMLRAVRFSAQLDLAIAARTRAAIARNAPLTAYLARERVAEELKKLLCTARPERVALLEQYALVPELPSLKGAAVRRLSRLPGDAASRWMGLALVCGDAEFLRDLRVDNATRAGCAACLAMQRSGRLTLDWKRAIAQYGVERAGRCAQVLSCFDGGLDAAIVAGILDRGECCTLRQLSIGGADLTALGLRGKAVGTVLDALLAHVWEYPADNTRETLLALAAERRDEHGG